MYYFPSIIFKYFLTVGTDNPVLLAISFLATPSPSIFTNFARTQTRWSILVARPLSSRLEKPAKQFISAYFVH